MVSAIRKPAIGLLKYFWSLCRMVTSMGVPAKGGFSFDLCARNVMLEKTGVKIPVFRKTGTTIVGPFFQYVWDIPCFLGICCLIISVRGFSREN